MASACEVKPHEFREDLANENHSEVHKAEFHKKLDTLDTLLFLFAFGHLALAEYVAMPNKVRVANMLAAFIASNVTLFNVDFCLPVEFVQAFFLGIVRRN